MDWAYKAALTAAVVAALLAVAMRWGRSTAGLLAGLPTVTGPALVWLSVDQGVVFATHAAVGAVAAAAPCALFAWGYACGAARSGQRLGGLLAGAAPAALAAWAIVGLLEFLLESAPGAAPWRSTAATAALAGLVLVPVSLVCLACLASLRQPGGTAATAGTALTAATAGALRCGWARAIVPTAAVSGLVSALAGLLAPQVGALWAGMLTSPPLLAAALAWLLHGQGGLPAARQFLRGYTVGLLGRNGFAVAFGALLAPVGVCGAAGGGVALALLGTWAFTRVLRLPEMRGLATHDDEPTNRPGSRLARS